MRKLICLIVFVVIGCKPVNNLNYVDAFTLFEEKAISIYHNDQGILKEVISPDEEAGWILKIKEVNGNYFKVDIIDLNLINVWVLKGNIGINTRNYDKQFIPLYDKPSKDSKIINYLKTEQTVIIINVFKKWALIESKEIEGKIITGWLSPEMQCGNPYTTCP